MILLSLWEPLIRQLSVLRALVTSGRIPDNSFNLMPAAATNSRFGMMEHFIMALAGVWLLFRVICCKWDGEDKQLCSGRERRRIVSTCGATDHMEATISQEETFFYGWKSQHKRHKPMLSFTRNQLLNMLSIKWEDVDEGEDYNYNDYNEDESDEDEPHESVDTETDQLDS